MHVRTTIRQDEALARRERSSLHDMHQGAPAAGGIPIAGIQQTLGDALKQLLGLLHTHEG